MLPFKDRSIERDVLFTLVKAALNKAHSLRLPAADKKGAIILP